MDSTTIRLSRQLHDRLARRAKAAGTTLAGVIERALDDEERSQFWSQAAATMGSAQARRTMQADAAAMNGTLRDGLDPAETWDDVW